MKQFMLSLPLTFVALSLAGPVSAVNKLSEGAERKSSTTSSLMETVIVTGNRQPNRLGDIAASVTAVDSDAIDLTGHTHISQLLSQVPGTWVVQGNGQEHLTALRSPVFTGAGSCGEFVVAEDGVPTRPVGLCNVNQLFELNTEQAGRIEVWRGPGAVVFGSNAVHGVFNIISPDLSRSNNKVSFEYGANDYARTKVSYGDDSQRLNFQAAHDGGYKDDSGFDQQKLSYKLSRSAGQWDLTTLLAASNLNQETGGYVYGESAYKDSSRNKENPNPEAYRDAQSLRWQTRFDRTLNDQAELSITPYARYSDMEFIQHFLPGQPIEKNDQISAGVQSQIQWQWQGGKGIALGADVEWAKIVLEEYQPNAAQGSAFLVATIPQGQHYDFDVDSRVAAVFANAEYPLSERTRLQAGTRFESVKYDYKNNMIDGNTQGDGTPCGFGGCRFQRPADRDDSFSEWNSQIGITHDITETITGFARYSQGYRAPQITELYRLQAEQQVADLSPEEVTSIELGVRGNLGRVGFDLVAYSMAKDNIIFRDADRTVISEGETEHYGIESKINIALDEHWQLGFNGTWSRHYYRDADGVTNDDIDNNVIDSAPYFTGSMDLIWSNDGLLAAIEAVRVGSYYLDPKNEHRYDGHTLVNFRGRLQLDPKWQLQLRILNLLDTDYTDRADYSAFGGYRYFIGEPRSAFVEASYTF